jgi:hypothetical protein
MSIAEAMTVRRDSAIYRVKTGVRKSDILVAKEAEIFLADNLAWIQFSFATKIFCSGARN